MANAAPAADASIPVRLEAEFDFTSAEYRTLFAASSATVFQSPLWLSRLMGDLLPSRGGKPAIITGRTNGGQLAFVLPLTLRPVSRVKLLEAADLGVSDYCAPVVDRAALAGLGHPDDIARAVAACLPPHDILRIRNIRSGHRGDWEMFFGARAEKLDFCAHEAHMRSPYAGWRKEAFTKSHKKYLDRRRNCFYKAGDPRLDLLDDPGAIRAAINDLAALRKGRFEGDMIAHDAVREFYAGFAADGHGVGLAQTWRLSLDGEPAGYVFGATGNGRFHYLLIGCDYSAWGKYSPGLVMYDGIMEAWCEAGGTVFDFTIGDEAFKADFGTTPVEIFGIERAATVTGRIALLAREARERLRTLGRKEGN